MFDKSDLQELLPKLLLEVLRSSRIISEHWNRQVKIFHKGPTNLVTETDIAVEKYLSDALKKLLPDAGFLGEESSSSIVSDSMKSLVWIVDPLDGTTNYAHHIPFVATSVGLWSKEHMLLGVVNCPLLDECFWAGFGLGAFVGRKANINFYSAFMDKIDERDLFEEILPLKVSSISDLTSVLLATGFPYSTENRMPDLIKRLQRVLPVTQGLRRCGAAAIDLAFVAAGRFDAYYEAWLAPWDTSAGWLLVEEAGGKVTGLKGAPYDLWGEGIIASNGIVHDLLLKALMGNRDIISPS